MRITVISDIHGRDYWERIYVKEQRETDLFIFLGDYFDAKETDTSPSLQADNLKRIRDYYHQNQNIRLLIGNHDLQYIGGISTNSFNRETVHYANPILSEMIERKEIDAAIHFDKYLFSHAGVSCEWMKESGCRTIEDINRNFHNKPISADFVYHPNASMRGENTYQSPLWIRPLSLMKNPFGSYHQIVGHTMIEKIEFREKNRKKFYFCDAKLNEYLVIDTEKETETIIRLQIG